MAYDGSVVMGTHQGLQSGESAFLIETSLNEAQKKFKLFVREWKQNNIFLYRDQLIANASRNEYYLNVDIDDLSNYDEILSAKLRNQPIDYIPVFEKAIKDAYISLQIQNNLNEPTEEIPDFQLQISTAENPKLLRELRAEHINKLIVVPGIVTSSSKPSLKATKIEIECTSCGIRKSLPIRQGLGGITIPRSCEGTSSNNSGKCPVDPYVIVPESCTYINQQSLKLQENPEQIPTGEIPRSYLILCDRYLVDRVTAGTRVKIIGILSFFNKSDSGKAAKGSKETAVKVAYIKVLGIQRDLNPFGKVESLLNQEDEQKILQWSQQENIINKIAQSIANTIYGHDDIKMALACLLFGGSPTILPDGTRLRGDINILLLGDPSTAKSQFLKFIERVSPIAVYTSGKGSSAAGLTAAIIKDPSTGEFQLEGGALVLADGGVVCIDEFDKMRVQDRVAIHEAMEQQTISVAKAGITTMLNSRTSILAAANPVQGKYDDLRTVSDQIEFQTTILSRFDCIFLVKDVRNEEIDEKIADHILSLHMGTYRSNENEGGFSISDLKEYITYAKARCFPRLTEHAAEALENYYVDDRKKSKSLREASKARNGIPVTVRQLEAIIRIAESLAKMQLNKQVTKKHVEEAHRIFENSTISAASAGITSSFEIPHDLIPIITKIEDSIRKRLAIGSKISNARLIEELSIKFQNVTSIEMAIINMVRRNELNYKEGRKTIERVK